MRVFGERGLGGTKMSDIAAVAGVSQGTLYNYVESKEALFHLLLDRALGAESPAPDALPLARPDPRALAARMQQAMAATFKLPHLDEALARRRVTDAAGELRQVIDELFERTLSTREAADMLERSVADVPELAAVFYGHVRGSILDRLATLLGRRMAAGHHRNAHPPALARLVLESVTMFARHLYHDRAPLGFDLGSARSVVVDTLVAGIVAGRGG